MCFTVAGMLWHALSEMSFSLLERQHTLLSIPACKQLWRRERGRLHKSWPLGTRHTADYDSFQHDVAARSVTITMWCLHHSIFKAQNTDLNTHPRSLCDPTAAEEGFSSSTQDAVNKFRQHSKK